MTRLACPPGARPPAGRVVCGGDHAVLEVDAPAGAGAAEHLHEHEDLVLILVRGSLEVTVGGNTATIAPGAVARLPRGVPHRVTAGPGGARYVCVCLPGGLEEVLAAIGDPESTDDDRAALLAAAGIHAVSGRW
ncbi:MAG: cupin domain-containing protein [Thermoleophilia bacterium]